LCEAMFLWQYSSWWMAPSLGCFNNTHLGTSDAVSERRPPHHRSS
jgi:hypothetical protein